MEYGLRGRRCSKRGRSDCPFTWPGPLGEDPFLALLLLHLQVSLMNTCLITKGFIRLPVNLSTIHLLSLCYFLCDGPQKKSNFLYFYFILFSDLGLSWFGASVWSICLGSRLAQWPNCKGPDNLISIGLEREKLQASIWNIFQNIRTAGRKSMLTSQVASSLSLKMFKLKMDN